MQILLQLPPSLRTTKAFDRAFSTLVTSSAAAQGGKLLKKHQQSFRPRQPISRRAAGGRGKGGEGRAGGRAARWERGGNAIRPRPRPVTRAWSRPGGVVRRPAPHRLPGEVRARLAGPLVLLQNPAVRHRGRSGEFAAPLKCATLSVLRFLQFPSWLPQAAKLRVTSLAAARSFSGRRAGYGA